MMKKPNQFLLNGLLLIMLFAQHLGAQSFQNTLNANGDDNYRAGVAVNKMYWVIGNTNSFAPSAGTEHILFSKYDGVTGVSVWDRKYYDNAATGIRYTATDIQAGYKTLIASGGGGGLPCIFTACPAPGPQVNAIGMPDSKNYFYVSGWYFDPAFGVERPIIMKLGMGGGILWVRTNVFAGNIYNEKAISVESCPNGDVIAVSTVTNLATNITFPAITRLDINGVLLWRYFYTVPPASPPMNWIPHQSCVFREFLNGNINDPIGIAITGETSPPGAVASSYFVMRVAANGAMLWKNDYPFAAPVPTGSNDIGWDIMFEAESVLPLFTVDNFIVTGLTNSVAAGPVGGSLGFVARMNVGNGAFLNCFRFGLPASAVSGQLMYGQGIYQSPAAPQNVVITGGADDSITAYNTYLMEMDITTGAVISANHYPLTTPNYPRTESVVSVGTTYPTPGFFISTNSNNTYGATLTDAHVIKTDVGGLVNGFNCPSKPLTPKVDTVKSTNQTYCTDQHCDNYAQKFLNMKKRNAPHVLCWNPFRESDDHADESFEFMDNEIAVFPNPVGDANEVTLVFTPENSGEFTIQIVGVTGKLEKTFTRYFEEGSQQFTMDVSDLANGMYLVRVSDGINWYSAKLIRNR